MSVQLRLIEPLGRIGHVAVSPLVDPLTHLLEPFFRRTPLCGGCDAVEAFVDVELEQMELGMVNASLLEVASGSVSDPLCRYQAIIDNARILRTSVLSGKTREINTYLGTDPVILQPTWAAQSSRHFSIAYAGSASMS